MSEKLLALMDKAASADADYVRATTQFEMELACERCESPIEQLMLVALMSVNAPSYFENNWGFFHRFRPVWEGDHLGRLDDVDKDFCCLYIQPTVLNYRADFAIHYRAEVGKQGHKIIIECDGHDFHERTKDQARRDRSRDREMTVAGYKVFRYTGSEIYRDPLRCAQQVADYIEALAQEDLWK